jgi:hypothetical protein
MHQERTVQAGIFDVFDEHEIGRGEVHLVIVLSRQLGGRVSLPPAADIGGGTNVDAAVTLPQTLLQTPSRSTGLGDRLSFDACEGTAQ